MPTSKLNTNTTSPRCQQALSKHKATSKLRLCLRTEFTEDSHAMHVIHSMCVCYYAFDNVVGSSFLCQDSDTYTSVDALVLQAVTALFGYDSKSLDI
jgi:hypothetical protein